MSPKSRVSRGPFHIFFPSFSTPQLQAPSAQSQNLFLSFLNTSASNMFNVIQTHSMHFLIRVNFCPNWELQNCLRRTVSSHRRRDKNITTEPAKEKHRKTVQKNHQFLFPEISTRVTNLKNISTCFKPNINTKI